MNTVTTAVEYGVRWTDEDGQPVEPVGPERTAAERIARLHPAAKVVVSAVTTSRTPWEPVSATSMAGAA